MSKKCGVKRVIIGVFIILVLLTTTLVGCGSKGKIEGTWEIIVQKNALGNYLEEGTRITFKNGMFYLEDEESEGVLYSARDGYILLTSPDGEESMAMEYSLSGDILKINNSDMGWLTFRRV